MNASIHLLGKVGRATVGIHSGVPESHVSAAVGLGTDRRGTGTIVGNDGLILTVNYLLIGAENIVVTLTGGEQYQASVVAKDYGTGLGLLKIEASGLPKIEAVSSADSEVGQDVFVVSSTGAEGRCADSGVITYAGPFDAVWEFVIERSVCVMTSSMAMGLSGGPICNTKGEVIAVSYLNFMDIGRSILGIPAEGFIVARDELVRYGRQVSAPARAWMGVLSYTLREHVIIAGVMPGSPGDKAGIKQGDVLLSVDGRDVNERRAFYDLIGTHQPGETIACRLLRNNLILNVEIPTVKMEDYFA